MKVLITRDNVEKASNSVDELQAVINNERLTYEDVQSVINHTSKFDVLTSRFEVHYVEQKFRRFYTEFWRFYTEFRCNYTEFDVITPNFDVITSKFGVNYAEIRHNGLG